MRDNKVLHAYIDKIVRDKKQMELFKNLKKEVETGANGTQDPPKRRKHPARTRRKEKKKTKKRKNRSRRRRPTRRRHRRCC